MRCCNFVLHALYISLKEVKLLQPRRLSKDKILHMNLIKSAIRAQKLLFLLSCTTFSAIQIKFLSQDVGVDIIRNWTTFPQSYRDKNLNVLAFDLFILPGEFGKKKTTCIYLKKSCPVQTNQNTPPSSPLGTKSYYLKCFPC